MLLECICRLCLTKYENPNQLYVISHENKLDLALASIFNKKIEPENEHLYKICGPCGVKLIEFHNFYVNVIQNEDKLLDIVLNEKIESPPLTPPDSVLNYVPDVGREVEIAPSFSFIEDDVEMSNEMPSLNDPVSDESSQSKESFDYDLSSPMDNSLEYFERTPVKVNPHVINTSYFSPALSVQPMEVEPIKSEERRKTRCNECGVYVINLSQHKRCVHDFSGAQECPECNTVFPNRLKLLMHKYYKHVPPRYQCEMCHKPIRTKGLLREHLHQKHYNGIYLYHCEHCEAQFNYRTSFVVHQKRMHPQEYENAKQNRIAMKFRP